MCNTHHVVEGETIIVHGKVWAGCGTDDDGARLVAVALAKDELTMSHFDLAEGIIVAFERIDHDEKVPGWDFSIRFAKIPV